MKILLLEDENKLGSFIKKGFEEQGYLCEWVTNGDDAYLFAKTQNYDALILDIMVPGRDGFSILKQLRMGNQSLPILIITARSELNEKLEGLNLGADDYITKPFYVEELIARLRTVLRRVHNKSVNTLSVGDLVLNTHNRKVTRGDENISLSIREFALLEYLMRSPGRVYSRTQLVEHVWESHFDSGTNLVNVYIRRLREKIDDGFEPKLIHTVRGIGYCIKES